MLANPMETQLVSSMGVKIGGRTVPDQPLELTRTFLADGREGAIREGAPFPGAVEWSEAANLAETPFDRTTLVDHLAKYLAFRATLGAPPDARASTTRLARRDRGRTAPQDSSPARWPPGCDGPPDAAWRIRRPRS